MQASRKILTGILFVLNTGIARKDLPYTVPVSRDIIPLRRRLEPCLLKNISE
jgi:hypothetical protein